MTALLHTTSASDTDLFGVVDFDLEVPCDLADMDCPKPAAWRNVARCCAFQFLFCEVHQDAMITGFKKVPGIICDSCGTPCIPAFKYVLSSERL